MRAATFTTDAPGENRAETFKESEYRVLMRRLRGESVNEEALARLIVKMARAKRINDTTAKGIEREISWNNLEQV